MCGIAGSVGYEPNITGKAVLHQYNRGPDFTTWEQVSTHPYSVVFGHNRLSIIDLSPAGNQPMHTARYSLIYNGEIYNYKELGFQGNDARVLLQYIDAFGIEQALRDINGMYAFAVYDKVEEKIHLVVDRFGQKPLYYYHYGNNFAFASSPAALLHLRDKWRIDEGALQSYWLLGSVMGEYSLFSGIKKVTGSQILTYDLHTKCAFTTSYWTPEYQTNTNGIEDLIFDAINKVKVADVPVFVFLSGGIDSTLVASQCKGMNAVHLDSPEYKYAKHAADKFGMNLIKVDPKQIDVRESLTDYALQFGEPSMAALIPYVTSQEVSKVAKVAISANGADELFFGYDRTKGDIPTVSQRKHVFRDQFFECGSYFDYWTGNTSRKFELDTYVQFDLNKTLDAASMCHSLEMRSPFLDHRLVEMALSIPEGKHFDMKFGRKAILKRMLQKMGFDREFLTRQKLGFSLHTEPAGIEDMRTQAWKFVKDNGFLKCEDSTLSPRDERYLKSSALSFWLWHEAWVHKLQ